MSYGLFFFNRWLRCGKIFNHLSSVNPPILYHCIFVMYVCVNKAPMTSNWLISNHCGEFLCYNNIWSCKTRSFDIRFNKRRRATQHRTHSPKYSYRDVFIVSINKFVDFIIKGHVATLTKSSSSLQNIRNLIHSSKPIKNTLCFLLNSWSYVRFS